MASSTLLLLRSFPRLASSLPLLLLPPPSMAAEPVFIVEVYTHKQHGFESRLPQAIQAYHAHPNQLFPCKITAQVVERPYYGGGGGKQAWVFSQEIGTIYQRNVQTPTTLPGHMLLLITSCRVLVGGNGCVCIVQGDGREGRTQDGARFRRGLRDRHQTSPRSGF